MVKIYVDLIRKGHKTIDNVPEKIRAEVEAILSGDVNA
ncbi:MAG: CD1375 family protein [Lachnotalea sp.]